MHEATLPLAEPELALPLFGTRDQHLQLVRRTFDVSIIHRDEQIRVLGEESAVRKAMEVLEKLKSMVERHGHLDMEDVTAVVAQVIGQPANEVVGGREVDVFQTGRRIAARTKGQAQYLRAIREHDLTIATGPAGSGKTYLAVASAVEALKARDIRKIVLVRPAVEAGESLGYLPGDLQAKINPYLRPLLDALHEMIDHDQIKRLMEQDVIEVIPLAYMRGRTLNEAFIILDEAQNTTVPQMKMFLTRMGAGSKIVVSGDSTQVDLPHNTRSGLSDAIQRLEGVKGVAKVKLTGADIVRHELVQRIVDAYERETNGAKVKRTQQGRL
ncbi:MAG: PhoH family protein [Planctomycetales bacterium]|nr:PhoH family protein [Planctomycetales bacterium]